MLFSKLAPAPSFFTDPRPLLTTHGFPSNFIFFDKSQNLNNSNEIKSLAAGTTVIYIIELCIQDALNYQYSKFGRVSLWTKVLFPKLILEQSFLF